MATLPHIDARFGWTATKIEQDEQGVRVAVSEEGGARHDVLEADYVVGCDGARSLVREQIGIALGGTDSDEIVVLLVFRSRELHERLKRFPERSTYRVMHPDLHGYWQFFAASTSARASSFKRRYRTTPRRAISTSSLLETVAGFPFACEFDHVGFWDLRVAVAESYQVGRAFIAGDAAHSHPPYGGFRT